VFLPVVNRGFADPDPLCDLPLEKPQLKPPLLDMVSPGGKDFRDIRRFLAFKNDFEAIPIGNASMSLRQLRQPSPRVYLHADANSKIHGEISGPLLDRIDIHIEVPAVKVTELSQKRPGEPSDAIRARVICARERQAKRFKKEQVCSRTLTCNQKRSISSARWIPTERCY